MRDALKDRIEGSLRAWNWPAGEPSAADSGNARLRHGVAAREVDADTAIAFRAEDRQAVLVGQHPGTRQGFVQAALLARVREIVLLGTEEEMIRANAERHVAFVQNLDAFRDRPVGHFPRQAVRVGGFPIQGDLAVAAERRGGPQPAARSLVDFRPEAQFNGDAQRFAIAGMIAKALQPCRHELTAAPIALPPTQTKGGFRISQPYITYIIRLSIFTEGNWPVDELWTVDKRRFGHLCDPQDCLDRHAGLVADGFGERAMREQELALQTRVVALADLESLGSRPLVNVALFAPPSQ